jgi:hypothetical protein
MASWFMDWTRKIWRNLIPRSTMMGERSSPPTKVNGTHRRTMANAGSVRERIVLTIGLYGSGFTQDKMAEIMTTQK